MKIRKCLHSKGSGTRDLAPVDIPAVKPEVSELQGSIAKAVVDFHDLDKDGKISGQREEWQLASRMFFDCKYKRNVW